jgi:glycosyltransferase involved in cell wall biosynthesis
MNTEVVQEGVNGFVCATDDDWYQGLRQLLASQAERSRQGAAARRTIVERYSVASNTQNFLHLFQ